jgi:hypothetical protein
MTTLAKVGDTPRQAIDDTAAADLPEDIRLLLRRLERIEPRQRLPKRDPYQWVSVTGTMKHKRSTPSTTRFLLRYMSLQMAHLPRTCAEEPTEQSGWSPDMLCSRRAFP